MKEIGSILKKKREELNLTIEQVAVDTKISKGMLKAIESGDLSKLPAKTFLRGFILTYSKHVKADTDHLMTLFQEEMGTTKPSHPDEPIPEGEDIPNSQQDVSKAIEDANSNRLSKWLITLGVVVLLILIIIVKMVIDKYEKEAQPTKTAVQITEKQIVEPQENKSKETENQEKTESQPSVPEEPQTESPNSNSQTSTSQNDNNSVTTETTQSEAPDPINANPQEVIIEALDQVTLFFRIDGGNLGKISLQPEQVYTLKAKSQINIDVSNSGAINVIHNGIDKGVPGDLGQKLKLKFPN